MLVSLGLARPAHAESLVLEAETTKFAITVDLAGACLCAAAGHDERVTNDAGCGGLCTSEVGERVRQLEGAELILYGLVTTDDGASMQIVVLTVGHGYDRNKPFMPQVRDFVAGAAKGSGGKSNGYDDSSKPFDLHELGELPFARFVTERLDTTMITHALFGTEALAVIQLIDLDATPEQMMAVAEQLLPSVRMPAQKPTRMDWIDTESDSFRVGQFLGRLTTPILLIGLFVWLARRRKKKT